MKAVVRKRYGSPEVLEEIDPHVVPPDRQEQRRLRALPRVQPGSLGDDLPVDDQTPAGSRARLGVPTDRAPRQIRTDLRARSH